MPHFYFDLYNHVGHVPDYEGETLADLPAARQRAVANIRSILASDIQEGLLNLGGSIQVLDGERRLLSTVRFPDAVELVPETRP